MRTIVEVTPYYPPHLGGVENCAAQIAERLAEKGYAVSVYTSDRGYSTQGVSRSRKPHVRYLKSIEIAHTPILFTLFFRLLTLPKHALIHLHVAQAFLPEIVYLTSKLRRIPYIAHFHLDVDPSGPYGFLLDAYKLLFLKRVLKSAAKIICLSEAQKQTIAKKYKLPLESLVVIPNGVSEAYFVEKNTEPNVPPRLLFVGRLVPQKNLLLLIEAIAQMKKSVLVDIVGEGELRNNIEALIQQQQLKNVQLHGKKTGKELLAFYQTADIFVLPSLKEGLSLSMLEALAAGLPIVASDLPELRPILGESGVLVQPMTATNYARILDELLSNKAAMQKLGGLAKETARTYSWENILNTIEKVYKEIDYEIR